jgi:hypothetical protein
MYIGGLLVAFGLMDIITLFFAPIKTGLSIGAVIAIGIMNLLGLSEIK